MPRTRLGSCLPFLSKWIDEIILDETFVFSNDVRCSIMDGILDKLGSLVSMYVTLAPLCRIGMSSKCTDQDFNIALSNYNDT